MPEYRVTWEIDIEAETPEAAAHEARQIQLDPESTATVFEVHNPHEVKAVTVDVVSKEEKLDLDLPLAEWEAGQE